MSRALIGVLSEEEQRYIELLPHFLLPHEQNFQRISALIDNLKACRVCIKVNDVLDRLNCCVDVLGKRLLDDTTRGVLDRSSLTWASDHYGLIAEFSFT